MDIKEAAHQPAADQLDADTGGTTTVRRRVLAAGLSGVAMSLLPFLSGRASASNGDETGSTGDGNGGSGDDGDFEVDNTGNATDVTTGGTQSDNTTGDSNVTGQSVLDTVPPSSEPAPERPTDADITLLGFVQSLELAIVALYDMALQNEVYTDALEAATVNTVREAHQAYGQAISGLIGRRAPNINNAALISAFEADFAGDAKAVSATAVAVENAAVATHIDVLGKLEGTDGGELLASIIVVEARHATLFHALAGDTDLDTILNSEAEALTLNAYPVK